MEVDSKSVDAAVLFFLYHEFKSPDKNLAELKRTLKPEGKLMILDWDPTSERERGPSKDHRIAQTQALRDLKAAGFSVDVQENYVEDVWMIIAHKSA